MVNRNTEVGQRPTSDSDCFQTPGEACLLDGPNTLSEWLEQYGDLINRICCLILGDRALGISRSTAHHRLHKALQTLRIDFDEGRNPHDRT